MKRVKNKLALKAEVVRDLSAVELEAIGGRWGWQIPQTWQINCTNGSEVDCTTQPPPVYTAKCAIG